MCVAFQVNDGQTPGPGLPGSQGELLSKRCITLVKTALKPEIWQNQCKLGHIGPVGVLALHVCNPRVYRYVG